MTEPLYCDLLTLAQRSLFTKFLICELISGTPKPIGCADLKWVKPEDLKSFEFPEADREIIEELIQGEKT